MSPTDLRVEAQRARLLQQRLNIGQLDYRRELARLAKLRVPQGELSRALGISQSALLEDLKRARDVSQPRTGFSGATSYEVCQRFALGELTRDELLKELMRWEFVSPDPREHGYFDDLRFEVPGSFEDVARARRDGLIDNEVHDLVLDHLAGDAE